LCAISKRCCELQAKVGNQVGPEHLDGPLEAIFPQTHAQKIHQLGLSGRRDQRLMVSHLNLKAKRPYAPAVKRGLGECGVAVLGV